MFHFPIDAVKQFLQKLTIKLTKEQLRPAQHFHVNNFGRPTAKYALECTICKRLWDPKNIAKYISKTKDEGCLKCKSDHGQSIAENFSDLRFSSQLFYDFTKRFYERKDPKFRAIIRSFRIYDSAIPRVLPIGLKHNFF